MNTSISTPPPEQPQILLQLRQKSAQLREQYVSLREQNKQMTHQLCSYSDRLDVILREKQIQERKSRSLMLLVTDLQRQLDDAYMQMHREEEPEKLDGENKALREILIKISEKIKQDQKLLSFLRQAVGSGPKATQFVQRSRYLQGQTELLAKLKSQVSSFANENLECSRKWNDLQRQSKRLEKEQGFLKIQTERIKRDLRDYYEDYLQRLNRSKAVMVNFNETQREKVITQYMIQQVAFLQQKRLSVQEESKNLKHHQESLLQENARIKSENRELSSFFVSPNSNEEHRLASRMKMRIQQLRDYLSEVEQVRNLPQLPLSTISEAVRNRLKEIEQSQCYIDKKIKDEEQGKMVIEEKEVISFFEEILRGRDERIQIAKEKQIASAQKLREAAVRRELLASQIENLEQGLKYHNYEHAANRITATSSVPVDPSKKETIGKWKDRKMNVTNLLTTTSKFVA